MANLPHQIWKTMSTKDLRQFAVAVFFLFAAIGPLTMLMDAQMIQGSWLRLLIMTVLSGSFSAAIVLSFNRFFRLMLSVFVYVAIVLSLSLLDPEFLRPDVPVVTIQPETAVQFSVEQLEDMELKRVMFGMVAIVCISVGYTLFVRALAKENKRRAEIETEVKFAQSIHESLLPKSALKTEWCEIAGKSIPAAKIGGDFYDIIPISPSKILVVVADASGHGTGAGILSAMTKSGIVQELQHTHSPAEIMNNVNAMIHSVTEKNMFVTCVLALFDRDTESVSIVTAGHPPVLYANIVKNSVEEFRTQNLALGIQRTMRVEAKRVPFFKNDLFCFITDGINEAAGKSGEQFGMERIKLHLLRSVGDETQTISDALIASVHEFSGGKDLTDDITAVTVKIV